MGFDITMTPGFYSEVTGGKTLTEKQLEQHKATSILVTRVGVSAIPVLGDAIDFGELIWDTGKWIINRTPENAMNVGLGAVGLIPFIPNLKYADYVLDTWKILSKLEDVKINRLGDPGNILRKCRTVERSSTLTEGGLNLFRFRKSTSFSGSGWKNGDYFLYLPNKYDPKLNWKQNSSRLREEMRKGNPIFDSHHDWYTGEQLDTAGPSFLNAERLILESNGWKYDPAVGAYFPPK